MTNRASRSRPIVAIDGPAGAGKSTVASRVAAELGFALLDTGAIYRAIALVVLEASVDPDDEPNVSMVAERVAITVDLSNARDPRVIVDGRDRTGELRTPAVSDASSRTARFARVRAALLEVQRATGRDGGIVAEGRDIGTVVFPDAEVKVFLTASERARAERRHAEGSARGGAASVAETEAEIRARDARDAGRDVAPLRAAADAVSIDTSGLTIDEVVARVVALARRAAADARDAPAS